MCAINRVDVRGQSKLRGVFVVVIGDIRVYSGLNQLVLSFGSSHVMQPSVCFA